MIVILRNYHKKETTVIQFAYQQINLTSQRAGNVCHPNVKWLDSKQFVIIICQRINTASLCKHAEIRAQDGSRASTVTIVMPQKAGEHLIFLRVEILQVASSRISMPIKINTVNLTKRNLSSTNMYHVSLNNYIDNRLHNYCKSLVPHQGFPVYPRSCSNLYHIYSV